MLIFLRWKAQFLSVCPPWITPRKYALGSPRSRRRRRLLGITGSSSQARVTERPIALPPARLEELMACFPIKVHAVSFASAL